MDHQATRLWRAWRTAKEMVADRGFELADEEINISLDDFRSQFCDAAGIPQRKNMAFGARPTPEAAAIAGSRAGNIWVEFCDEASVGVRTMRAFAHSLQERAVTTGILIYQTSLTASASKVLTAVDIAIETFAEADLLVNITRHELVPRHSVLAPMQKKALLERYRLTDAQLPRIQTADPVARYFGLRRGQVVKIIRRSETSGRYVTYRIAW